MVDVGHVDAGRVEAGRRRPGQALAPREASGGRAYEFGRELVGLQAGALDREALRDGAEEARRFADFVRRHRQAATP